MSRRQFALIAGVVYVFAGVLGFTSGATQPPPADTPLLTVDSGYGYLFGLFPINVLHNLVHIALGLWGIIAYLQLASARIYARSLAVIYGVLTVMGLLPGFHTTFGLLPLFGHVVWLHALTALAAAYFGFLLPEANVTIRAPEARTRPGRHESEQQPGIPL